MKINFNNDGTVSVEVSAMDDESKALRLINAIRSEAATPKPPQQPVPAPRTNIRRTRTHSLNSEQYQIWTFLVDNDCEEGVHRSAVERHFGLGYSCAGQRLGRLVKAGVAYRVSLGRFRAEANV